MQTYPLCKITYSIAEDDRGQQQKHQDGLSQNYISQSVIVLPGMSTYEIAQMVGNNLGCGYRKEIQQQICAQLSNILYECPSSNTGFKKNFKGGEESWRLQMNKLLQTSDTQHFHQLNSQPSQKRNPHKSYFQINYDKFFKCESEKQFNFHENKENIYNIYERSLAKKKQKEEKLSMFKQKQKKQEIYECTFSPSINNTFEFLNKKKGIFFHKQNCTNNAFDRLYKQSFDLRQKKKQRIKTLQNQQEAKLSQCSFVPVINECSRQICRIKSHASFIYEKSDLNQKSKKILTNKFVEQSHQLKKCTSRSKINCENKMNKQNSREQTQKKNKTISKFHPEISQSTKRLTKNIPNFFQGTQKNKQKKGNDQNKENITKASGERFDSRFNRNFLNLRKQTYTIEEKSNSETDKLKTQKIITQEQQNSTNLLSEQMNSEKQNNLIRPIQEKKKDIIEKRSQQLFHNRKKSIFQRIFNYLALALPNSAHISKILKNIENEAFSDKKQLHSSALEVGQYNIENNPDIPGFIKQILSPISSQLGQLSITLNKEQFIWAIQKLFEGLTYADRGSFLGWGVKLMPNKSK